MIRVHAIYFLTLIALLSCSQDKSHKGHLGLEVGMTKPDVVSTLKLEGSVTHIKAELIDIVKVTNRNKGGLGQFDSKAGIVLQSGTPTFYMKIALVDGQVSDIYLAPINEGDDLGVELGMKFEELLPILDLSLESGKVKEIFNFLPDSKWIELVSATQEEFAGLFRHDYWVFNQNDEYSRTLLEFENQKLKRIQYDWSPVELP